VLSIDLSDNESLRTRFTQVDGHRLQIIDFPSVIARDAARSDSVGAPQSELARDLEAESTACVRPGSWTLMRVQLVRLAQTDTCC